MVPVEIYRLPSESQSQTLFFHENEVVDFLSEKQKLALGCNFPEGNYQHVNGIRITGLCVRYLAGACPGATGYNFHM